MKTHALRADGRAVCGLEIPADRLVPINGEDGRVDTDALGTVTCSSCLRLSGNEETAGRGNEDEIRAIVREEISLGIEQLLRVGETADVLAVSKKKVLKLVKQGELSVVAISDKKHRIPASSVEAYIRRRTVKA